MIRRIYLSLVVVMSLPVSSGELRASERGDHKPLVRAVIQTTLPTNAPGIRQFAFDDKAETSFVSKGNPTDKDHFTLAFDQPVVVRSIEVLTGKANGEGKTSSGKVAVSVDGKSFEAVATFDDGVARANPTTAKPGAKAVRAVRITAVQDSPLVVREIKIDSEPGLAVFKHPIEIMVNVDDAREMKAWAEKVAGICERHYPMIVEELWSEGFKPRTLITMTMKKDYKGVAAAAGGKITGSVDYFSKRTEDVGAMVHETAHCVQNYRTRGNPGWLVEGVADYVRFFKFELGKIGRIKSNPQYNDSYRTTAAFLHFAAEKYDKQLVRKLNAAMREGEYHEGIWKTLTKKTVQELNEEWRTGMK